MLFTKMLQNAPPLGGDECSGSKFDRQDILVLLSIFAETGKSRLSVKPRPYMGRELHYLPSAICHLPHGRFRIPQSAIRNWCGVDKMGGLSYIGMRFYGRKGE
jgi:hypothetical protein